MEFSAQQIAAFLQGTVEGNASVKVSDFSKIEDGKPGTLSFLSNPKYNAYIYDCKASIVLVNNDFVLERPIEPTLIRVANAYESLAVLMNLFEKSKPLPSGISSMTSICKSATLGSNVYVGAFVSIGEQAKIGENVRIYANCYIGNNVQIADNTVIHAGVNVYDNCLIGSDCIIHSGACIGSDGFGFAPDSTGTYTKIPQLGNVVIGNHVEIGANTTIDRATFGSTRIDNGVKLDNLIQIAHNVEIGENTVVASQTGISGSTKIGKKCIIAGQVGVAGHIQIADGTILGAQSGLSNSIKEPGQMIMGYPAIAMKTFQRAAIVYKNLPDLQRIIYELQRKVEALEKK